MANNFRGYFFAAHCRLVELASSVMRPVRLVYKSAGAAAADLCM